MADLIVSPEALLVEDTHRALGRAGALARGIAIGGAAGAVVGAGTVAAAFPFVWHWAVPPGIEGGIALGLLEAAVGGLFVGVPLGMVITLVRWLRPWRGDR